jgi:hypothetical protein
MVKVTFHIFETLADCTGNNQFTEFTTNINGCFRANKIFTANKHSGIDVTIVASYEDIRFDFAYNGKTIGFEIIQIKN